MRRKVRWHRRLWDIGGVRGAYEGEGHRRCEGGI